LRLIGYDRKRHPDYGIVRLVYLRPTSAACSFPATTMTPSLIMSTMLLALPVFRKKTWLALVAARTLARAATMAGACWLGAPSDIAISPGPHSAKATPGILTFCSALASAYLSSSFRPSSNSPLG